MDIDAVVDTDGYGYRCGHGSQTIDSLMMMLTMMVVVQAVVVVVFC